MKEIPILFSTPMVQAILEDRKTVTRRVLKFPKCDYENDWTTDGVINEHGVVIAANPVLGKEIRIKCPYGKPGDLLWVRETHNYVDFGVEPEEHGYVYKASENGRDWEANDPEWKWKPSIFMPKEAARIWLQVTDVSVERLQDITDHDAGKEGIEYITSPNHMVRGWKDYEKKGGINFYREVLSFRSLWRKINGPDSWETNPWVWVVRFKVISKTGKP